MNPVQNIQWQAQVYASNGLITCAIYKNILNRELITKLALNILLAGSIPLLAFTLPILVPIGVAAGSLIFACFNIHLIYKRFLAQKEAQRWEPVFQAAHEQKYGEAINGFNKNLVLIRLDSLMRLDSKKHMYEILVDYIEKFSPLDDRGSHAEFFQFFQFYITASNGFLQNKSHETFKQELKAGYGFRCSVDKISDAHELMIKINNGEVKQVALAKVANISMLLFIDTIREMKACKGVLQGYYPDTLRYFKLMRDYGEGADKISSKDFDALFKCKNDEQLQECVLKIDLSQYDCFKVDVSN